MPLPEKLRRSMHGLAMLFSKRGLPHAVLFYSFKEHKMKKVYLHGENDRAIKEVEIAADAAHHHLLEVFKREFQITDTAGDYVLFFEEDEIFADGTEVKVEFEIIHKGHYHAHRCKVIKTTVSYNGQTAAFHFKPAATGKRVLHAVIHKFGISPVDAADLLLKVDDKTIVQPTDHIGSFVGHHDCSLALMLVADKVVQG